MASSQPRTRPIEILAIGIGLAIAVVWATSAGRTIRVSRPPTACASNLRSITTAMYLYGEEGNTFPMATDTSRAGEMSLFAHRDRSPLSGGPPSPSADIFMVLRNNNTTPKHFICPSTVDTHDPAQDTTIYFDFADRKHLSYSYVYQYHPHRQPIGYNSDPLTPVLADSNPYLKGEIQETATIDRTSPGHGNSTNHRSRDGQNVAFVDGHVSFIRTPLVPDSATFPRLSKSVLPDNIYTTHATGSPADPGNAPTWARIQIGSKSDYCLVP